MPTRPRGDIGSREGGGAEGVVRGSSQLETDPTRLEPTPTAYPTPPNAHRSGEA